MTAPQDDARAWREVVLSICGRYPEAQINARLRELEVNGFITNHGSPRTGWLTSKGQRALQQAS